MARPLLLLLLLAKCEAIKLSSSELAVRRKYPTPSSKSAHTSLIGSLLRHPMASNYLAVTRYPRSLCPAINP
jgi:hypothetical protein